MTVVTKPFQLRAHGATEVGLVREANEDAWRHFPELNLFVLADGMGGHNAGEVAANEAVNRFCNILKREFDALGDRLDLEEAQALIYDAIQEVNEQVHCLGQSRRQLYGMGTTLCALYFHGDWAVMAHVGDSRIYRLREEELEQMTSDHSLFQEMVDQGSLDKDKKFSRKHVITKAVGIDLIVEPTLVTADVRHGDRYLLCSDGLTDLVHNHEIAAALHEIKSPKEVVTSLIQEALGRGGIDNTTVVAVDVEEGNE